MVNKSGFQVNVGNGHELLSRKVIIAAILGVALIAFEIFNFDTTQFALQNLLGDIRFAGVMWARLLRHRLRRAGSNLHPPTRRRGTSLSLVPDRGLVSGHDCQLDHDLVGHLPDPPQP